VGYPLQIRGSQRVYSTAAKAGRDLVIKIDDGKLDEGKLSRPVWMRGKDCR